jgi:glycosyltransferase involved in cell wall biosynthesis
MERSGATEQASFIIGCSYSAIPVVKKWKPDITLAFFGIPSGVVALVLKAVYKIPYIVSLRGGDVPGFRPYDFAFFHKIARPLLKRVWRKAEDVIANSGGLRSLANEFDPNIPIRVIPNGVDVSSFEVDGRDWNPPKLLSVGRVVYQKGFDVLLQAMSELKSYTWSLSIAGDGPLLDKLNHMAAELEISDRVCFLGWQNRGQLVKQYAQANLFVYTSRQEGMPNAVLEAMASGLPVIASRVAGSEELVQPGVSGILVPPEDPVAFREALVELLLDAELRESMGASSLEIVEKKYSWKSVADQYLERLKAARKIH